MAIDSSKDLDGMASNEVDDGKLDEMLYSAHAAINSQEDLMEQRATSIPALFSTIYKFIQNPSSVSVDTFKRMIDTDDTIGSGADFLTTCLAARLGPYTHPNKEITAWVNDRLAQIKGGWFNTVKEVLSASWAGFSVTEKVWRNDPRHGFVPHKLVTLPPTTVMFETERTGELTSDGILQYQRNWSPLGLASGQGFFGGVSGVGYGFSATNDGRPDPFARFGDLPFPVRVGNTWQYLSIRIPTQKCIHYAFDAQGKFGNPYGRALSLETPILTANGWKTMGSLQIGDYVFDEQGNICTVIEKSEVWENRPTYLIKFSDGTEIEADENHQWLTMSNRERYADKESTLRTTKEMFDSMNATDSKDRVFSINVAEPLNTPNRSLLIDPYVLGMWLGDGNSNSADITTHMNDVDEQMSYVHEAGYETGDISQNGKQDCKGRRFHIMSNVQTKLRVMNLLHNKHIPQEYLLASREQRIRLLQGLMDSDGYIMKAGYQFKDGWVSKGGHASFANCNYDLITGVAQLVRSLGITCTIAPKKRGWGSKWKLDAWEVRFTPVGVECFRLKRKLEKQQITGSSRNGLIYIKSIERIENKDTVCIEVNSPNNLFLAGEGLTPTHNSLLRRCYKYYILKDSTLQMLATALDRKGTPLLVVYADPNTTVQDSAKVAGRTENMRGQRVGTRADQAAAAAFSRIHNDSVIVLPGKKGQIYEVEMMAQTSNQEAFIATLDFCNKSIMRALLIPSLIFTNGDGTGSYALGQEHAKTFLKILDGMLEGVDDVLLESLVREMLAYNFPREVWEKDGYGKFTRRDFSDENLERLSQIWDRAIQNGIIDPNDREDLNRMRDTLGFPEIERNPMQSVPGQANDNDMGIVGDDDRIERGPQAGELETSKEDEGYNGAQVTAILDVLERVSTGLISELGAVNLLIAAFQMTSEQAHAIVSGVQKNAPIPTGQEVSVPVPNGKQVEDNDEADTE